MVLGPPMLGVANANKETLDLLGRPPVNHKLKGSVKGGLWQHQATVCPGAGKEGECSLR